MEVTHIVLPCMQDAGLNPVHSEKRAGSVRCAQSPCRAGTKGTRGCPVQPERIGCWGKEVLLKDLKNNICLNRCPNHKGLSSLNGMEIHLEVRPVSLPPSTCPLWWQPRRWPWGLVSCSSLQALPCSCWELALAFTALTQKLLQNLLFLWHETVPDTYLGSIGSHETPKGM